MSGDAFKQARKVFEGAMELPAPERDAFALSECQPNTELLAFVRGMLAANDQADQGGFLAEPTAGGQTVASPLREGPGTTIGRYKLLQQIGEGGFGVVFLAEQREPVQRKVALKVIKLGMDTRAVVARFEAERQALAMMDHPNIAKVLDAGATETGRPYFVMELVKGDPITNYCDTNNLSIAHRLDLFQQVCHAVQHAHQKGIIHRDIKPSNVLVTVADGKPIPKVIDFGIAKATSARLTEKTLFTEHRALIGTPEYMSPEQAEMSGVDIDTRSDIYSLGVLLYELLTGALPFDAKRLRSAAFGEIQRIIREEDPPNPSTRLSTLATLASVAAHRRTEPGKLSSSVRGDLDWIVMRAMEKDRTRRYETANALAMEIDRYLKNEPVLAGPPSRVYRCRKFVKRNRAMVTAAAVVAAALLAGLAGTTFGLLRAEQQRALAEKREKQTRQVSDFQAAMLSGIDVEAMGRGIKERFRDQVRAALERQYVGESPDRRQRTSEEVESELAEFDQRADAAQAADVARRVMDEFVLARAAEALEKQFPDQSLVQAQLHVAIGRTYGDLGLYDAAEPHLQTAMEIRLRHNGRENAHPEVAECLYNLAGLKSNLGSHGEAEILYRDALAMWRVLSDKELVARTLEALANAIQNQGQSRFAEAEELLNEALRLNRERVGDDHPSVIGNLASLAALLSNQGRLREAEALNRQVLQWRRGHFGDQHPKVAHVLSNLAQVLARQEGRRAEAEELFREALAIHRAVYGDEHPRVAKHLFNLGVRLVEFGRRAEGETCLRQALAQQRKLLGDHHPDVRQSLSFLANVRRSEGDYDEGVALLREALAIAQRAYPDGNPEAWRRFSVMNRLGGMLADQAKLLVDTDRQQALALFQEAEPLILTSVNRLKDEPNMQENSSTGGAAGRKVLESFARVFEFWHNVAPDRGWGERAAEWRAELEKLSGP